MSRFPHYKQAEAMDCGPTCLRIIAKYFGKSVVTSRLRDLSETTREGTSLLGLSEAAEKIGFRTHGAKITFDQLKSEAPLPCIVHWEAKHFVVLYKFSKNRVFVSDPAHGLLDYPQTEFLKKWSDQSSPEKSEGIVLLLEPTLGFDKVEDMAEPKLNGLGILSRYILRYRKFLIQLIFGLFAASLIQLIFPFITQSIVDVGISNRDINFINLILFAQLFLFLGRISIELVRGWILLHLSTRINLSLVSDFFIKLMRLPISYFDSKMTGDIMQRINDHSRIENLLTSTSLNTLFSIFNLFIFAAVLAWYNLLILSIFLTGTLIHLGWVFFFMKKRRALDYRKFSEHSNNQSKIIELINGMQEIKLHNAEMIKRWEWERIQARLFKISASTLGLEQFQTIGTSFVNEIKNITITVLAANLVIQGELTLGMMLSISYIIGQMNAPVYQIVNFFHAIQDANISIERIAEIHSKDDEESSDEIKIRNIPHDKEIHFRSVSFRYKGTMSGVLDNISFTIPPNKTTAIVGASGSGKTTLMKLLLKFYEPTSGEIRVGNYQLVNFEYQAWRNHCGVVMQEGHIFNDTIARNVAVSEESPNIERLIQALEVANIREFIETLPLAYNTKIGNEGLGLSSGQKQRLLIARAVYKSPKFILFDEATSALDSTNERIVMSNLQAFFKDRTALIIAHRLSTVQSADQIIVLKDNKVAEVGNHFSLLDNKGVYYHLVKNQLQLENL